MKKNKVFISYKRVDKELVFKLKDQIEDAICPDLCWVDLDGIESDAQFSNVIANAINNAEVFLFMYSLAHSQIEDYENDWTVKEIFYAQKKRKRIVFIKLDETPLTDYFELNFGFKQQIDAKSIDAVAKLIQDMRCWLSGKMTVEQVSKEIARVDEEVGALTYTEGADGRFGYKDLDNNIVISCQWNEAWAYQAGLARVRNAEKKIGFIDKKGVLRIDCKWEDAKGFSEGLAPVKDEKGNWGYINLLGEVVIPCQWKKASQFKEDVGIVQAYNDKRWYIDRNGYTLGIAKYLY